MQKLVVVLVVLFAFSALGDQVEIKEPIRGSSCLTIVESGYHENSIRQFKLSVSEGEALNNAKKSFANACNQWKLNSQAALGTHLISADCGTRKDALIRDEAIDFSNLANSLYYASPSILPSNVTDITHYKWYRSTSTAIIQIKSANKIKQDSAQVVGDTATDTKSASASYVHACTDWKNAAESTPGFIYAACESVSEVKCEQEDGLYHCASQGLILSE